MVASGRFASAAAAHWRWRAGQEPGQSWMSHWGVSFYELRAARPDPSATFAMPNSAHRACRRIDTEVAT
jgi:hypothetical protein